MSKTIFTPEQNQFMRDNYATMSYADIAKELGFTERQIRGRINNMGLSKIRKFNKKYFNSIDAAEKAYWLGFIYADGYIICNPLLANYEFGIELKSTDDYLLKQLSENLGGVHSLEYKHNCKRFNGYEYETDSCRLRVYSKDICNDLISNGVVPNKTLQSIYPQCNKFFQDFVRGFLDGDGCIYIDKKNHIGVSFTNANKDFLEYINTQIKNIMSITGSIYKENDKKYKLMYYRQNDVKRLLDWVYTNKTICLNRKYDIYTSYYN